MYLFVQQLIYFILLEFERQKARKEWKEGCSIGICDRRVNKSVIPIPRILSVETYLLSSYYLGISQSTVD